MATAPRPDLIRLTPEEYLAIERRAEFKSECFNGVMYPREGSPHAMSGTSYRHTLISRNLQFEIHSQFKGGPCQIVSNDLRVAIGDNSYAYPDLVIVCGEPRFIVSLQPNPVDLAI